jgi:hypothetical protein
MRPLFALLLLAACPSTPTPARPDSGVRVVTPVQVTITGTDVQTRTVTREHLLAAAEMQLSGEPLAEAMGRNRALYSRFHLPTDLYFDDQPLSPGAWVDVNGFSTAIESYEYSKMSMNELAFEAGAGTALAYAPSHGELPDGGLSLAERVFAFGQASHAAGRFVFPPGTYPSNNASGDVNPTGAGTGDQNPLGWPGLWPTLHVFTSFEPAVAPTSAVDLWCAITSDDDPGASGAAGCADYECNASTLHLVDREAQVEKVISVGADGFSGWKYGLWVINYLQVLHDANEAAVSSVSAVELSTVGAVGNQVVGLDDTGAPTAPGTFLGSSDIEGFQASVFLEELDQRAEDWLRHLSTADGVSLGGFASLHDALAYDEQQPLRWFPSVAVTETDGGVFPRPTYALASADSALFDQLGLVLSAATSYALTDQGNTNVGGTPGALAYFDGAPFAADNQQPDGEATLHDRSLAVMRVALVNLDRLHVDPASGVMVDEVVMHGATPTRGQTVSTTSVAYSVIALRTALRSLGSTLALYSNNTPDAAQGTLVLDGFPLAAAGSDQTFSQRVRTRLRAQGALLLDHLTTADGRAFAGWNVSTNAPVSDDDTLDAHTAAIRGLFATYLATGDVKYRTRAMAVFGRLEAVFYDADARVFSATPAPVDTVVYTPLRFALLQSTLRDVYELVASRPGNEAMALELESKVGRLNTLVLNGWDDRNGDRLVDYPEECITAPTPVMPGDLVLPRGGLQMAERTLTGEIGSFGEDPRPISRITTSDRDSDCVPEIDDAKLPASLASSITLHLARSK